MSGKISLVCLFALLLLSCREKEPAVQKAEAEADEQLSGGENLTVNDLSENAFGEQARNLTSGQSTDFVVGNSTFRSNWVTAPASVQSLDGLGPLMNATSCGSCHFKDGRAKPPGSAAETLNGLLFRLSIPGTGEHDQPVGEPNYGGQLQDKAILNVSAEASVRVRYQEMPGSYDDGTRYSLRKPDYEFYNQKYGGFHAGMMFSPRIAQQIPGLGLLENVPESTIMAFADENDANGDGISGRTNMVWDEVSRKTALGRFGWKSNVATIKQQVAGAFNGDMGITTSVFPDEEFSAPQKQQYGGLPNGGRPEISDKELDRIVFYVQTLAVPIRRNWADETVLRGRLLFSQLNCSGCHIPQMQTGSGSETKVLNNQRIRPYTDLLIHDMGAELADNRPDFQASGREWRTPPLWGIGMIRTVNKHTFLLHDGRARNLEEAVLWHGGEAEKSQFGFKKLAQTDRKALVSFLESL